MFPRNTRDEHHTEPDARDDNGRTEIRLEKDEYKERRHVRTRDRNVAECGDFHMPPRKIFREYHHEKELGGVRRLYGEKTEVETILGAFDDSAEEINQCQRKDDRREKPRDDGRTA